MDGTNTFSIDSKLIMFKQLTERHYNYIKYEYAFRSGLDYLFSKGYPEAVYRWIIDHGHSEAYAEAEAEQCVRAYYLN